MSTSFSSAGVSPVSLLLFLASAMFPRLLFGLKQPSFKPTRYVSYTKRLDVEQAINTMEERIGRGEGGRGIESIVLPGSLSAAASALSSLPPNSTVVILSGFPCCVDRSPPSETDGPPGAFSVARAAVALGLKALILTDECNEEVFMSGAAALGGWAGGGRLQLESFPPESDWGDEEARRLIDVASNRCDHIVAIERPGRARDGSCYTMRGIRMDHLLAPLDKVIDVAKEENPRLQVTAIGDGGNELGMGKVYDDIVASEAILMPDECVAVRSCDNLIVASVSNWGGFALAAAAGLARYGRTGEGGTARGMVERCLQSREEETRILANCVEAGCRDGVSGKMESTVDGMSLETSLDCLEDMHDISKVCVR
mmetsp:Transcript_21590/g.43107  ORF Transcript_21590/g.43107 Transcript_21590/m.43107 type:complete len:370 (-) Transcript_21590:219-1328(-)